jgi:hypothetical protein
MGLNKQSHRPQPCRHHHRAGTEPNSSGHGMQPTVSPVQLVSSPAGMGHLSSGNHLSSRLRLPWSWAHPNADSVPSRSGISGRFRAMPIQLVSVYAEVPIRGVPGTKLLFCFAVVLQAHTPHRGSGHGQHGPSFTHVGALAADVGSRLLSPKKRKQYLFKYSFPISTI